MPDRRDLILQAVAGKGAERGLYPEKQEDGTMFLRYLEPQDEVQDNLHKQAVRSLVKRMAPDHKIHIQSAGESGFIVEVRPAPGTKTEIPAVEPGPVMVDKEVDLTSPEKIKELHSQLTKITEELGRLIVGFAAILTVVR